jgi:hypothetical protein
MNEPGPQFIKLYRGVNFSGKTYDPKKAANVKKSRDINFDRVGIHWTDRRDSAELFAAGNGKIITAYVNKKHIVNRGTPEHKVYAKEHQIHAYDEGKNVFTNVNGEWNVSNHGETSVMPREYEVTVRKDAPVHIMSTTDITEGKTDRGRTRRKTTKFDAPIGGLI